MEACKGLGILPDHYLEPITHHKRVNQLINLNPSNTAPTSSLFTFDNILKEFPSAFDEQIRTMTDKEFHIYLTQDAKPFASTHHAPYHLRIVTTQKNWNCYSNRNIIALLTRLQSDMPP